MRFDKFLDVVYYAMLQRLSYDKTDPEKVRQLFDQHLEVNTWRTPGAERKRQRPKGVPDNAPSWWKGDEDASQTFLHAMGIVTTNGGGA